MESWTQPAAVGGNGRGGSPPAARERPNGPNRVAFYTRISTDEDHQKYSLGAQAERLDAFSKAAWGDDWRLHKIFRDTESGTHMNRPGLEEMLFDAEAQAFDTLLVFRVDRLSRKVRELCRLCLPENGQGTGSDSRVRKDTRTPA
jgi:site-specific DNA recombinase